MKITQFLFLAVLLLGVSGCFPDDDVPVYENVEGVVLNSDGDPVVDVAMHIRNHFNPGGFRVDETSTAPITISFNVPNEDVYIASVFRHGSDTTIATFFEDTLSAGQHSITIPDSLLSNGVYGYEVRTSISQLGANLFLVNKPDSLLPKTLPFTGTSFSGRFSLNANHLALGRSFNTQGGGGFDITDSLQILIEMNDEIIHTEEVRVMPDQSNFFEITLD